LNADGADLPADVSSVIKLSTQIIYCSDPVNFGREWMIDIQWRFPISIGGKAMRTQLAAWTAIVLVSASQPNGAPPRGTSSITIAASEIYIQQARGRVTPGANIQTKPTPETTATTTTTVAPAAAQTAPVTCNAQNASSQACYTATQQARPGR